MALYTQTYTFTNGTTADGGQVNTEVVALGTSVNSITNAQVASNAAIAISKTTLGTFTNWDTWTPTWDTNGAGTLSATALSFARYTRIGNVVWLNVAATHTVSGTDAATTAIRFTMPVNTTATSHIFFAYVKDPADDTSQNPSFAQHVHSGAANKIAIYRTHAGNAVSIIKAWSNGTLRAVWCSGFYEVA